MALARTARAALARSLARTRKRTGRASKFENTMVRALRQALPPGARVLEQFPARCAGHAYRLDAVVELSGGARFAVEWDGPAHYSVAAALGSSYTQFARDRAVEAFCLAAGMSLFRVPYTYVRRPGKAATYCITAAARDRLAGCARVHYLDYMRTYVHISAVPGAARLGAAPDAVVPGVHVRG
jgi:hypothetical protein